MYYELYVDSLFLVNFVMNLYLLLLVNQSTHRTATRWRLVLGAALGAGWYLLPFLFTAPAALKLIIGLSAGTITMLFTAFDIRSLKAFVKLLERLLLYSFLMGGALLCVIRCFPRLRSFTTGIFGIMGIGAMLAMLLGFVKERQDKNAHVCYAILARGGNKMKIAALVDSGNSLREPISGKPVSIIEQNVFRSLWKEESPAYRAIPYHSIGKSHGIMQGYLLPELHIETDGVIKSCRDVYVAVSNEKLSGEVKMILNPALLGNEEKEWGMG